MPFGQRSCSYVVLFWGISIFMGGLVWLILSTVLLGATSLIAASSIVIVFGFTMIVIGSIMLYKYNGRAAFVQGPVISGYAPTYQSAPSWGQGYPQVNSPSYSPQQGGVPYTIQGGSVGNPQSQPPGPTYSSPVWQNGYEAQYNSPGCAANFQSEPPMQQRLQMEKNG